jgi:hypothetical protein
MLRTLFALAINQRFNLDIKTDKVPDIQNELTEFSHYSIVTQDWDELNEFIYLQELNMVERPLYFDPYASWSGLIVPKIKIRWAARAKQVKIGQTLYNILDGSWDEAGAFTPHKTNIRIFPYYPAAEHRTNCVLVPFKQYTCTQVTKDVPEVSIAGEKISCVYSAAHYNICFNRQGLYINRKFRDKVEPEQIPDNFEIIEPAAIEINFGNSVPCLKINLAM